jgi:cytochrome c-type biogenesis protein CcmF
MHSIAATEKRGVFRSWTLLLAILTFSLSLLGTFLVRSGILTSVHAFASDPERGIFILIFLGIVVGGSLLLFALRGPTMRSATTYSGWSRETMLLINNVFLVSSLAMILIGTLYPLLADVLDMGKISVGPPYFNIFFVPLMSGLMICLGFAGFTRWKNTEGRVLLHKGVIPSIVSLVMAFALPMFMVDKLSWSNYSLTAVVTLLLVLWVVTMSLEDLWLKSRGKLSSLSSLSGSYWGMLVAHIGLAVCALGVGLSTAYDAQTDLRMLPGDKTELGGYQFQFVGVERVQGPNFIAYRGNVEVKSGGELIVRLSPEKRNYTSGGQVMTEADIDGQLHRDLYVSLGEPLGNQAWAIRFQVKPFVRCIWLGGLLIGLGGLLAALDKRYRRRRLRKGADESSGGLVFE